MSTGRPEVFGEIWVHAASVTSEGLAPGTSVARLIMDGDQIDRFCRFFGKDLAPFRALGLIVKYGKIRTDPMRIEVEGWKREWLQAHGMEAADARRAASLLKQAKFIEPVYGERGAAGGCTAVLAGGRFGWEDVVTEVMAPSGRLRRVVGSQPVDNSANAQVTTRLVENQPNALRLVDNPEDTFGGLAAERVEPEARLVEDEPNDQTAKRQVNAIGDLATKRVGVSTPKEVSKEGSSLLTPTGEVGPLTRTSLREFFTAPEVVGAVRDRIDAAVVRLAATFAHHQDRAASVLGFLDRDHGDPDRGDAVDRDLAWFLCDMITKNATPQGLATQQSLMDHLRRAGANLPKTWTPSEFLPAFIVAVVATTDTDVDSWPRYFVWAMKQDRWASSTALKAVITALNAHVYAAPEDTPPAPPEDQPTLPPAQAFSARPTHLATQSTDGPTPISATSLSGLPTREPLRAPQTLVDIEMASRGPDGYWAWLRDVADQDDVYSGEENWAFTRRSKSIQRSIILRHYRSRGIEPPASE